jgi:cytochrome P450
MTFALHAGAELGIVLPRRDLTISTGGRYRPPAPIPQPKQLGLLRLLSTLKRNPLECWSQEHFEKPIVAASLPFTRILLVHEPRAIKHVLLDNAANYRKDSIQRRVLSAGLGDGLLSAEGDQWRTQRRILAPVFARKTIMDFAPAMLEAANALVARWRGKDGQTIDVAAEASRLTLDVLERTIFSDGFGRDAEEIRDAMGVYFNTIGKIDPLDLIGLPPSVPRFSHLRVRSTLRVFESAIDQIIALRRQRASENTDGATNDILTLLLAALDPDTGERMSEAEVRSNILTFIAAGHETTANTLTWSLFLLSQSAEWRERVAAEACREFDGPVAGLADRLVETRAVIDEAIRLYPPIAAMSRVATGDDRLDGTEIKRGTMIVIAPYVLHRHQLYWQDPDGFDPGRFLGKAKNEIDRFTYIPFGAGARTCIGSAFALQEATLVLATLMKNFDLKLAPNKQVWPLLRVTLRPADGLQMTIKSKAA